MFSAVLFSVPNCVLSLHMWLWSQSILCGSVIFVPVCLCFLIAYVDLFTSWLYSSFSNCLTVLSTCLRGYFCIIMCCWVLYLPLYLCSLLACMRVFSTFLYACVLYLPVCLCSLLGCMSVCLCIWGNHRGLNWAAARRAGQGAAANDPINLPPYSLLSPFIVRVEIGVWFWSGFILKASKC